MEGMIGPDKGKVEKFLNGMYGGRTSSRRKFMVPEKGVDLDVLRGDEVGKTPFFDEKVRVIPRILSVCQREACLANTT
jgi:hypothetical protein